MRRADVIVCTSPQFFTACATYVLSLAKRRPFVFELRDLWPDSILAVGAMRESLAIRTLRRLEYFLYRKAALVVSVTHSFKEVLASNGIPREKIAVIPNGADLAGFQPGEKPAELVERHGLEGKFVVGYIGTIGMAHGLGTLLDAAERLRDDPRIAFLVVGDGAERSALEESARRRSLRNVRFAGPVGKDAVKLYWRLCDAALVLLKDRPVFRHVLPSKMFEAMASARPIVLGVRGESADLLRAAEAGVVIPPEDDLALAEALKSLAASPQAAADMGARGRRYVEGQFDRERLAAEMLDCLRGVAAKALGAARR